MQAEAVPSMKVGSGEGAPAQMPPATTIADGIAVRAVGATPFELVKSYVDEIVTVSEGEIANAVLSTARNRKDCRRRRRRRAAGGIAQ